MKILSLEQMNKLKQLGVDTDKASIRVGQMIFTQSDPWYGTEQYDIYLLDHEDNDTNCFFEEYRTFTLQDVIELLPKSITDYNGSVFSFCIEYRCLFNMYTLWYISCDYDPIIEFCKDDLLQAAYEMLLWVIENGYLKTN